MNDFFRIPKEKQNEIFLLLKNVHKNLFFKIFIITSFQTIFFIFLFLNHFS